MTSIESFENRLQDVCSHLTGRRGVGLAIVNPVLTPFNLDLTIVKVLTIVNFNGVEVALTIVKTVNSVKIV